MCRWWGGVYVHLKDGVTAGCGYQSLRDGSGGGGGRVYVHLTDGDDLGAIAAMAMVWCTVSPRR